jgi:hypothetical protein
MSVKINLPEVVAEVAAAFRRYDAALRSVITSYGHDFATVNIEYQRPGSDAIGRQSQTWARMPEGWRIVAAHVSLLAAS